MARLTAELREQTNESARLDKLIWANLEDLGYGGEWRDVPRLKRSRTGSQSATLVR